MKILLLIITLSLFSCNQVEIKIKCKHKHTAIHAPSRDNSYYFRSCIDCRHKIPLTIEETGIINGNK